MVTGQWHFSISAWSALAGAHREAESASRRVEYDKDGNVTFQNFDGDAPKWPGDENVQKGPSR